MKDEETKKTKRVTKKTTKKLDDTPKVKKTVSKKVIKKEEPVKEVENKVEEKVTDSHKNLEFTLVEVIVIILITAALVSLSSGLIVLKFYNKLEDNPIRGNVDSSNEILENYNYILENYVDDIDANALSDAAIQGMYNYLEDEYSMYLPKDTTDSLQKQLAGKYSGVGIEITMNEQNQIVINRTFTDSPAYKAGLKKGDILIKLDDTDLSDKDTQYVASTIQESDKAEFNITYLRDGKEATVKLVRELIEIDSVLSSEYGNVGYLKIDTFSGVTVDQIKTKLDSFSKNVNSLVIDLRDNTGGYLTAAHDISELFLEKGSVIYQIKDKDGNITKYKASNGVYKHFNKITVLINENSASASEILTLALKENLGASVVGTKSFGKGTVQETKMLNSGAMVKYTTSYWLSPKGNSINKIGIVPDYEETDPNNQLEKAITVTK